MILPSIYALALGLQVFVIEVQLIFPNQPSLPFLRNSPVELGAVPGPCQHAAHSRSREQGKPRAAPGAVCRGRREADESVLKMMKPGVFTGRHRCLENPFRVLEQSKAEDVSTGTPAARDRPLLSIPETCGCTTFSHKSFREPQSTPGTSESPCSTVS